MPRINIEERWVDDPRRSVLIEKIGEYSADGLAFKVWKVAQQYYRRDHLVPIPIFKTIKYYDLILDVGLAEVRGDFVYIRGSSECFQWLKEARENGRNGGLKRASIAESLNNISSQSKPIQPSSSSSPSPSSSSSFSKKEKKLKANASGGSDLQSAPPVSEFIRVYIEAFQSRYGGKTRPELGGKTIGRMKKLLEDYPLDRATQLVQVYFQMKDKWFETKCHDFETFIQNLQKVNLALDTGTETFTQEDEWYKQARKEEEANDIGRL